MDEMAGAGRVAWVSGICGSMKRLACSNMASRHAQGRRAYLEGFVAAAGSTAGVSVAGGKHGQGGEEPQMTEVLDKSG